MLESRRLQSCHKLVIPFDWSSQFDQSDHHILSFMVSKTTQLKLCLYNIRLCEMAGPHRVGYCPDMRTVDKTDNSWEINHLLEHCHCLLYRRTYDPWIAPRSANTLHDGDWIQIHPQSALSSIGSGGVESAKRLSRGGSLEARWKWNMTFKPLCAFLLSLVSPALFLLFLFFLRVLNWQRRSPAESSTNTVKRKKERKREKRSIFGIEK